MVIEILVAQGESEKTLPQQILYGVFDAVLIAGIGEALGKQTTDTQPGIDLAQEKDSTIGTDIATLEVGNDFAGTQVLEKHGFGKTGCRGRAFFS
jgi:hypothetical protein